MTMTMTRNARVTRGLMTSLLVCGLAAGGVARPMARSGPQSAAEQSQGGGRAGGGPDQPATRPALDGRWALSLETPHGAMTMVLQLALDAKDGRTVTGTLRSDDMGEFPLTGEFAEGRLTFRVTAGDNDLRCAATFKDADHLSLVMSAHGGDMAGLATRMKGR